MRKCQNPFQKDSDEGDNKYLAYVSSYGLIYANYLTVTTRKYVHIPAIYVSF